MVDPASVLIGVPILGPVVIWLFREVHEMRKFLERLIEKETVSRLELASALTKLEDTLTHRVEIEKELIQVLRERR